MVRLTCAGLMRPVAQDAPCIGLKPGPTLALVVQVLGIDNCDREVLGSCVTSFDRFPILYAELLHLLAISALGLV